MRWVVRLRSAASGAVLLLWRGRVSGREFVGAAIPSARLSPQALLMLRPPSKRADSRRLSRTTVRRSLLIGPETGPKAAASALAGAGCWPAVGLADCACGSAQEYGGYAGVGEDRREKLCPQRGPRAQACSGVVAVLVIEEQARPNAQARARMLCTSTLKASVSFLVCLTKLLSSAVPMTARISSALAKVAWRKGLS